MKNIWKIISFLLAIALAIVVIKNSFTKENITSNSSETQEIKDAYSVIMNRSSVRSYLNKSVEPEVITKLLKAAMAAPSGVNKQPWAFIAVTERDVLDKLAEAQPYAKMLLEAPAAIVVCGYSDPNNGGSIYWIEDCSAATENLLLAAESMGLGAVWTTTYPHMENVQKVRELLNIPSNVTPLCVVSFGYPKGEPYVKDKWKPEKIHYNKWK